MPKKKKSKKLQIPKTRNLRILLFVLLFGLVGGAYILKTHASCVESCGGTLSPARSKIVYIAVVQRGQTEFNSNVLSYTDGHREAWCADFVSWVYKQAGHPFTNGLSGGWRWPVASSTNGYSLRNYVTFFGKFKARGTYTPVPGDIIFYDPVTYTSHVGIVISVAGGKVTTVEGNIGNRTGAGGSVADGGMVGTRTYYLGDRIILGYGDIF